MTLRIGIAGIAGRMGRLLAAEAGPALAAGSTRPGSTPPKLAAPLFDAPEKLFAACDVVIDFTTAAAAETHAALAASTGKGLVLGTSGLSPAQEAAVADAAKHAPIVYAANFAPGVTLLFALVERMAKTFGAEDYDIEIVETHHRQKIDSPSGTAIALGRAAAKGRGVDLEAVKQSGRDGHHGPRATGAIGFATLRGGQVVGEHEVRFLAASEHITLGHRSFDRGVYAKGAVRAARWLEGKSPGLYGMTDVLAIN